MFEGFTDGSKRVLRAAQEEARRSGHNAFGPEHILLGLLRERHGAFAFLQEKGLNLRDTRFEVEKLLGRSSAIVPPDILFNSRAKVVMQSALQVAGDSREAEPHHLLLGLLREQGGPLHQLLDALGVNVSEMFFDAKELVTTLQPPEPEPLPEPVAEAAVGGPAQGWAGLSREERQATQYRWAPDGRRVVLATIRGLWVVERARPEKPVSLGAGQFPAWSPDGRRLAFYRSRELLVWDGPANRTEVIDDQATPRFDQPWSPDGGYLAFIKQNNLVLWELDTRQIKVLTHLTGTHLAQFEWLPPTGELITYLSNNVLWVAALDGSGTQPFLS